MREQLLVCSPMRTLSVVVASPCSKTPDSFPFILMISIRPEWLPEAVAAAGYHAVLGRGGMSQLASQPMSGGCSHHQAAESKDVVGQPAGMIRVAYGPTGRQAETALR